MWACLFSFWGRAMGDTELSREEFYHALGALSKAVDTGFHGVNARLDVMNGRVNTSENRLTAIETREHERDRMATRDTAARTTSAVSLFGSFAVFIWQKFFTP
jgi:hypothetical protein